VRRSRREERTALLLLFVQRKTAMAYHHVNIWTDPSVTSSVTSSWRLLGVGKCCIHIHWRRQRTRARWRMDRNDARGKKLVVGGGNHVSGCGGGECQTAAILERDEVSFMGTVVTTVLAE